MSTEALLAAIKAKDVAAVRAALADGASPGDDAGMGDTAFTFAAGVGDGDVVAALLEAGADPDAAGSHGTRP